MIKGELNPTTLGAHFFRTLTSDEQLPAYTQTKILFQQFLGFSTTSFYEDLKPKERELHARCLYNFLDILQHLYRFQELPSPVDLKYGRAAWQAYLKSEDFNKMNTIERETGERVFEHWLGTLEEAESSAE